LGYAHSFVELSFAVKNTDYLTTRYFMKTILTIFFLFSTTFIFAQIDDERPIDDYATPYNAVYSLYYYSSAEHFAPKKLERLFPKKTQNTEALAVQLRQIIDGKGLRLQLQLAPMDSNFVDSLSKRNIYMLFTRDLTDIYLERDPATKRWQLSRESAQAIPRWHKRVYPLGSDWLVNLMPAFGSQKVFGLAIWQYLAIFLFALLAYLQSKITSAILRRIINTFAESRLGKGKFDTELVLKTAKVMSYIIVISTFYILFPILQLPIGFSYYIITALRLTNTVFVCLFLLRLVDFFRTYIQKMLQREHDEQFDDHLAPIVVRILKTIVIIFTFFHGLTLLDVNIATLVAGLSIGGLAIAFAAQETVKNLIGSAMIYADRPFKIGDYVSTSEIEGTVEDIGFRSTRIRTLDTSLVAVPNGKLMDMTINNLGERQRRRFRALLDIPYHTPPDLIALFLEGLRQIVANHPHTAKDLHYIRLNTFEGSSLRILFVTFFLTNDYAEDIKYREEVMFAIIRLAEQLGVQFAYPSQSLYIESMPERKDNLPDYPEHMAKSNKQLEAFMADFKSRHPQPNLEPQPVLPTPENKPPTNDNKEDNKENLLKKD
jgi:MscS family membrane protein